MASSNDIRDIMGLERPGISGEITKAMILGTDKPKKNYSKKNEGIKKPEGMARELFNLLYNDSKDAPPIIPTDAALVPDKGYKQLKAKLGMRKVRPWKWMKFTNPARKDGLVLKHWRRAADEGKDYPFAKFDKKIDVPSFTDIEYQNHLVVEGWTKEQTNHLLDLCQRFDLRFTVITDRWDKETYSARSMEDLKERYYGICEKLEMLKPDPARINKPFSYDAEHERKRKDQLNRLYNRTREEVEEEEILRSELKRIEAKKKEREKKTQDLQKLIAQADSSGVKLDRKVGSSLKKKASSSSSKSPTKDVGSIENSGIKFSDLKGPGVTLRSQRMKLPQSVGQKKSKAIEQMLQEIGIEAQPMPTEEICVQFNEMRSDMVLLYELKNALATCQIEMQSLKAQYENIREGKTLEIPDKLKPSGSIPPSFKGEKVKNISDVIDVVGNGMTPPIRKRKAALEQSNVLKKIKNKTF